MRAGVAPFLYVYTAVCVYTVCVTIPVDVVKCTRVVILCAVRFASFSLLVSRIAPVKKSVVWCVIVPYGCALLHFTSLRFGLP